MTDITIPPEALEKATDAVHEFFHNTDSRRFSRELARAACLALIENWPGMSQHGEDVLGPACIILPLTQDDER